MWALLREQSFDNLNEPTKTRGAGGSIKPGVERSGTPGFRAIMIPSARSVRKLENNTTYDEIAVAHVAGSISLPPVILGFRFAPPQALCCRHASRACPPRLN